MACFHPHRVFTWPRGPASSETASKPDKWGLSRCHAGDEIRASCSAAGSPAQGKGLMGAGSEPCPEASFGEGIILQLEKEVQDTE